MQSFCCKRVEQQPEVIKYICLNDNCQNISVCCEFCKQKNHTNHQSDCMLLNDIINNISEEYDNNYTLIIEEIQVIGIIIKESIDNLQKYLKNIFKTSMDKDELIFNLDYAHIRKSQVKCFLQAQQQFEQQTNLLKQISNQFENKNSIILQDISQSENDINRLKQQLSQKQTKISSSINIPTKEQQKDIDEMKAQEQQINKKIIFFDDDEDQDQGIQQEMVIKSNQISKEVLNSNSFNSQSQGLMIVDNQPRTQFQQMRIIQNNSLQRIHEVVKKPLQYFCNPTAQNVFASDGKDVKFSDVIPYKGIQGCFYYVMFYLASFCPQKLYEVFKTKEITSNGQYEFVIKNKIDDNVILQIDDTIPNGLDKRILLSKNNSICFTMLMKAIAENFNGYEKNLNSLYNLEFLVQIFNSGLIIVRTESDDFSEQLQIEIDSKSLILFPLRIESQVKVIQVLEIKNVKNLFNEETQLFKLRSAYGRDIYKGEWGFQSPYWTDDMKEILNVSDEDDGIFYMDLISFIQEPIYILSLRINQQLQSDQNFFIKKQQASYFRLDVTDDDNYLIQFEQLQIIMDDFKPIIQVFISELQTNQLIKMYAISFRFGFSCVLKKGSYAIYVKCPFLKQNTLEAKILIYGLFQIQLTQIQKIENYKLLIFNNEIDKKGKVIEKSHLYQFKILGLNNFGWYICKFINFSNNVILIKEIEQFERKYKICKPYNDKLVVKEVFSNEELTLISKLSSPQYSIPKFQIFMVTNNDFCYQTKFQQFY